MVDSNNNGVRGATLLRDVARRFVRSQRATTACCGGRSEAQCHVLGELARSGPLRVTDLSRSLGADKGWTSRAVTAMEADGLLTRSGESEDGRAVTVRLTATGTARWRSIDAALNRHAAQVLAGLPRDDQLLVERALELLQAALSPEGGRARSTATRRGRRAVADRRIGRSSGRRP